ncbi:MAG: DUF342 domain-containing protein [Candidatus Delongbacteria bacterium]|nr:DUF342 domain-containing protein [Candidatus Delongbacteria bacterium]
MVNELHCSPSESDSSPDLEVKNNKYCLRFNPDRSEAYFTFYDIGRLITVNDAVSFLVSKGLKVFDRAKLEELLLKKKYNEEFLIASGTPPRHGQDTRLKMTVNLDPQINPDIQEDGTVDFKTIRSIPTVKKGEIIAEILEPTSGVDGEDVFGERIKAHQGQLTPPPIGINVAVHPDNPIRLIAEKSGHILISSQKLLEIRDILIVEGDLDYAVGNIDFDGTVIVKKDVKSSFSIKAQGNIEVMGSVEDAVLISEKSIIIKNGFVGKGTGNVTAKEDVIIHHISSQTVHAGRDIIIGEESMNANLRAENSLKVLGKKGTIIGGSAYALHLIETKIAGTGACIPTILSAGITRENFARIRELEGLIEKNQENLKRIKQNVYTLFREKLDKNQLPPDKENLLEQMKKAQASLPLQIDALQHELEQLNAIREKLKFSNVQVTDTAFPKVRIVMGEDIMELREAYRSAVFMLEKGTISLFIKGKRVKLG